MIKTIEFNGKQYPYYQPEPASQFIIPFAKKVCEGEGYDIGCNSEEDKFPGARGIDLEYDDGYHADKLPHRYVDYIFSSHCLEHVPDWVETLDYWKTKLKIRGTLFLYLPHYSQEYWRPWNNRKHIHVLSPEIMKDYLESRGYENIFISDKDLNNSFACMAERGMI